MYSNNYKKWIKESPTEKKDGKKRIEITQVENGFIIEINESWKEPSGSECSSYQEESKCYISKINPLETTSAEHKEDLATLNALGKYMG